jgi:hypothetical protein
MYNKTPFIIFLLIVSTFQIHAQLSDDIELFTIPLINDPSKKSLFNIHEINNVRDALSGPVVMNDDNLLFCSEDGYVLFDQSGTIIDSHSVFRSNKGLKKNAPGRLKLAYPMNTSSLLFFKNVPHNKYPVTIYEKKILRGGRKPLGEDNYEYFKEIQNQCLYNLTFNVLSDDMRGWFCIQPRLVGFYSPDDGHRWWSVDAFYSFSSPIVHEEDGVYKGLYPGLYSEKDKEKIQAIEPLQIYNRYNQWFYTGISARVGTKKENYYQTFYVFDQAANFLYADTLLKLDNMDAIIGEDEYTYYTAKKVKRYVFKPTVNKCGDLFYGIFNFKKKKITVRRRQYYVYKSISCGPKLEKLVNDEKCLEYVPVRLQCTSKMTGRATIPKITLLDLKTNKYVKATEEHLSKDGYICYITRMPNKEIKKKLARSKGGVPRNIRSMIDSLSKTSTVTCPYRLVIRGPNGMAKSFNYPPGVEIICARVMSFHKSNELLIRVDCENYAEALIFRTNGTFVNRFVFNNQHYELRQDIIVSSKGNPIIELDYESEPGNQKYFMWIKGLAD